MENTQIITRLEALIKEIKTSLPATAIPSAPPGGMSVNERYFKFVKQMEGLRLVAYDDKRPNHVLQPGDWVKGTLTIGFGHTGPDVFIGKTITEAEAYALLDKDNAWAQKAVNKYVRVPLGQNQFNSLVSFTYNIGETAFKESTLVDLLNGDRDRNGTFESPPDYDSVPAQLRRWIYSDGEPILKNRREHEVALWLEPDNA
jgi:lysozyme